MGIVKSLLFGSQGSYNLLGQSVDFKEVHQPLHTAEFSLPVRMHRIFNLQFLHTFCHEMSHAIMGRKLGISSRVEIYRDDYFYHGITNFDQEVQGEWKKCAILSTGPVVDMLFSSMRLLAFSLLMQSSNHFFNNPFLFFSTLALASFSYGKELKDFCCCKRGSDIARIRDLGSKYLASAVLGVSLAALPGAMTTAFLLRRFFLEGLKT